jgi:hypothetical protein
LLIPALRLTVVARFEHRLALGMPSYTPKNTISERLVVNARLKNHCCCVEAALIRARR